MLFFLNITANRDEVLGVSPEEQAWMVKELCNKPLLEGREVTLSYGASDVFYLQVTKRDGSDDFLIYLNREDLTKFITKNRPYTTSSKNSEVQ